MYCTYVNMCVFASTFGLIKYTMLLIDIQWLFIYVCLHIECCLISQDGQRLAAATT